MLGKDPGVLRVVAGLLPANAVGKVKDGADMLCALAAPNRVGVELAAPKILKENFWFGNGSRSQSK